MLRIGVGLGCVLSPIPFLLVLYNVMNRAFKSKKRGMQWGLMESL